MGHGLIAWIIIGVIAGWLTGKLMKGSGFGFFMDMIVGLVGALVGGFLASHLGFGGENSHGLIVSIIIAVIGAVILTVIPASLREIDQRNFSRGVCGASPCAVPSPRASTNPSGSVLTTPLGSPRKPRLVTSRH